MQHFNEKNKVFRFTNPSRSIFALFGFYLSLFFFIYIVFVWIENNFLLFSVTAADNGSSKHLIMTKKCAKVCS